MQGELTSEERARVEKIIGEVDFAYDGLHAHHRRRWDHFDGLYNNFSDLSRSVADASPRDRDSIAGDARNVFGADLFIPHCFATVELVVARTLATPPKMLFLPKRPEAVGVTRHIKGLMACQQNDADYELTVQSIGKNGHIYNIGIQKCMWRKETREASELVKVAGEWVVGQPTSEVAFDGPDAESVSPYEWIWDPFGTSLKTLRWAVHRTWRSDNYVLRKLGLLDGMDPMEAEWSALAGRIELEDVVDAGARDRFTGSKSGRDTARRLAAGGSTSTNVGDVDKAGNIHEVWERHDAEGNTVEVLLDRTWPVAEASNPNWKGGLPFHIYRPTQVPDQIVGKGSIEPIEDLQHETNMLRTDRRWNALLKLHQAYAINAGSVDLDDVKIGPGTIVEVNGDPNGLLAPLTVGDIPNSGYMEEDRLIQDFFRTSGIQDPNEQAAAPETATGVQLVQQATQARTWLTTRRCALEIVKPGAKYWLQLDKQRILKQVPVRVPQAGDLPYAFLAVGPEELQRADFDIEVEGGLEAQNVAQDRQDAQMLLGLAQDPELDGTKLKPLALEKLGLGDPEQYLAPQKLEIDPEVMLQALTNMGMPPEYAQIAVQAAVTVKQQQVAAAQGQQQGGGGGGG